MARLQNWPAGFVFIVVAGLVRLVSAIHASLRGRRRRRCAGQEPAYDDCESFPLKIYSETIE